MADRMGDLQIRKAARNQACSFPLHSTALVSVGASCDPCAFVCDETYRKRDGKCVCDAPLHECNGKCTLVRGLWLFDPNIHLMFC